MPVDCLRIEARGPARWVWMQRPDLHNAFDETLIAALAEAFDRLGSDAAVRVIVLAGEGRSFSAGADLDWMRRQAEAPPAANLADALGLAHMLQAISQCPVPTIARVHGAALGGGLGLAAACDLCVASTDARFATSEVRLGLIPATIGPYVLRAIGERQARRYFLTGERISAERAREIGLVHELVAPEALDDRVQELIDALIAGGPQAQSASKQLIRAVAGRGIDENLINDTAQRIAQVRATPEAREGIDAFLGKRPASWVRP